MEREREKGSFSQEESVHIVRWVMERREAIVDINATRSTHGIRLRQIAWNDITELFAKKFERYLPADQLKYHFVYKRKCVFALERQRLKIIENNGSEGELLEICDRLALHGEVAEMILEMYDGNPMLHRGREDGTSPTAPILHAKTTPNIVQELHIPRTSSQSVQMKALELFSSNWEEENEDVKPEGLIEQIAAAAAAAAEPKEGTSNHHHQYRDSNSPSAVRSGESSRMEDEEHQQERSFSDASALKPGTSSEAAIIITKQAEMLEEMRRCYAAQTEATQKILSVLVKMEERLDRVERAQRKAERCRHCQTVEDPRMPKRPVYVKMEDPD